MAQKVPFSCLNPTALRSASAPRATRTWPEICLLSLRILLCKKTHLFFECFPYVCLSRACLGKMIIFSTKWYRKRMGFVTCTWARRDVS